MFARVVFSGILIVVLVAPVACKRDSGAGSPGRDAGEQAAAADGGKHADQSGQSGADSGGKSAQSGQGGSDSAGAHASAGATAAGRSGASAGRGGAAAGSGGSAGADQQAFFGDSRCSTSLLLCDGFEAATLDKTVWQSKFTAPTLDKTRAARGSQSLHFNTNATSASGVEVTKIFPTANNNYYGRMFVYFDALPTAPQWAHWTVVGAKGTGVAGEIRVGGQFDGKLNRFGVGSDGGPTGDWTNLDADVQNGSTQVREDQWLCVEWQHDGATDRTRFFLDGVEHPSLATTRDVKHAGNASAKYDLPDITAVWVGFWNYDQGKAVTPNHFDVWIDEVALDDERIGCTL